MPKTWTCKRVTAGARCGHENTHPHKICRACGKTKPPRKRPAHLTALDASYDDFVALNGGEFCFICGRTQKPGGRRLHRDHDHRTGRPRGLLCFPCNAALRTYMTPQWLRRAAYYLERENAA
jgi:hypothetical protein